METLEVCVGARLLVGKSKTCDVEVGVGPRQDAPRFRLEGGTELTARQSSPAPQVSYSSPLHLELIFCIKCFKLFAASCFSLLFLFDRGKAGGFRLNSEQKTLPSNSHTRTRIHSVCVCVCVCVSISDPQLLYIRGISDE